MTYQIGQAGTVAIYDAGADKPTVVFRAARLLQRHRGRPPDGHASWLK